MDRLPADLIRRVANMLPTRNGAAMSSTNRSMRDAAYTNNPDLRARMDMPWADALTDDGWEQTHDVPTVGIRMRATDPDAQVDLNNEVTMGGLAQSNARLDEPFGEVFENHEHAEDGPDDLAHIMSDPFADATTTLSEFGFLSRISCSLETSAGPVNVREYLRPGSQPIPNVCYVEMAGQMFFVRTNEMGDARKLLRVIKVNEAIRFSIMHRAAEGENDVQVVDDFDEDEDEDEDGEWGGNWDWHVPIPVFDAVSNPLDQLDLLLNAGNLDGFFDAVLPEYAFGRVNRDYAAVYAGFEARYLNTEAYDLQRRDPPRNPVGQFVVLTYDAADAEIESDSGDEEEGDM